MNMRSRDKGTGSFDPSDEKEVNSGHGGANMSSGRSLRTLPFLRYTFEEIAERFYVHDSIARVVSRADVPEFSCEKTKMTRPAYGMIMCMSVFMTY